MQTPHDVLGVKAGASQDEIKRAFRIRSQLLHPDRHSGASAEVQAAATAEFRKLVVAYEELMKGAGTRPSGQGHQSGRRPSGASQRTTRTSQQGSSHARSSQGKAGGSQSSQKRTNNSQSAKGHSGASAKGSDYRWNGSVTYPPPESLTTLTRLMVGVVILALLAILYSLFVHEPSSSSSRTDRRSVGAGSGSLTATSTMPRSSATSVRRTSSITTASTTTTSTTAPPSTASSLAPAAVAAAPGLRVTNVIDGDTLDVSDGSRIRLIGIDSPERGQCGFGQARDALGAMVAGRTVNLVPGAQSDADRYGRLLRYVEVEGGDVNLAMIQQGHAIARFDGLDGYGRHPRQDQYRATDAVTPLWGGCPNFFSSPPPPATTPTLAPAGREVYFRNCREAWSAGAAPIYRGQPGYRSALDRDNDGIACERRP